MKRQEFKMVHERAFANPLLALGFTYVGRGSTLRYLNGTRELRIINQAYRREIPGVWSSVICFRHTFLRPINSDDPNDNSLSMSDFPRRFNFQDFNWWIKPKLDYRCPNERTVQMYNLGYADLDEHSVEKQLRTLVKLTATRVLPWVNSLSEESEFEQIRKFGEQRWDELRWMEDYENFLLERR